MCEYDFLEGVKHLFITPSLLILLTRVYSAFSNGLLHVINLTLGMSIQYVLKSLLERVTVWYHIKLDSIELIDSRLGRSEY